MGIVPTAIIPEAMLVTKRKLKPNKPQAYRQHLAFCTGIESAKRTIDRSMRRRYWIRGFLIGLGVGSLLTTLVYKWLTNG